MKNYKIFNLLALVLLLFASAACSKDDLVFDHELPQFPTKEGAYLLEVIMPQATLADNDIYIVGAFNGGDPEAVVGDMRWKLEKCTDNNVKWGIYLYPSDFAEGTSLADGYTFFNEQQGIERSLRDEDVLHTECPELGGRINVTVNRWAAYFETPVDPGEIPHDGYVIYVDDQTGWDALAMYAWGDAEICGAWPGMTPTGTVELNGTRWKYFDTGEENAGFTEHLIFNNNNGGVQLKDFDVVLDRDYYVRITADGCEEVEVEPSVKHDGYAIFVINNTGWDAITMYAWGTDLPELFGGWPGVAPTGTQKINGVEYTYWDCGAANNGLHYTFIANNNNGGKQIENNDVLGVDLNQDYYFLLNADLTVEAVDPKNPPVVGPIVPPVDPVTHPYTIYVENTLAWDSNYLYAWGDKEVFGGWPGKAADGTKVIDGATYYVFNYDGAGETLNLILNNGSLDDATKQQVDGPAVTGDSDYYFKVTANGWEAVNPNLTSTYKIYIDDQTGWEAITLYAWGDNNSMFGEWPGMAPTGTVNEGGVTYKYFEVEAAGETENLIFNNNGGGSQLADFPVVLDRDYWLTVTATGVTEISK